MIANIAVAAVAVPIGGSLLLARTYRTDPWLADLPKPDVTMTTHAVATACAVLLMTLATSLGISPLAAMILGPLMGIALLTDISGRVLPNLLNVAIAIAGIALALLGAGLPIAKSIAGMAAMGAIFWLHRRVMVARFGPEGFALGDVKLFAATAAILPFGQVIGSLLLTPLLGLALLGWRKLHPCEDRTIPMGSLFVGALTLLALASPHLEGRFI